MPKTEQIVLSIDLKLNYFFQREVYSSIYLVMVLKIGSCKVMSLTILYQNTSDFDVIIVLHI